MYACKINFLRDFFGKDKRSFVIPIYQRKYKWTSEQCNRLIDDIINAAKEKKEHFTGTIIYQKMPSGTFEKAYLVDGQQRVTTIMLILKSLQLISKPMRDNDNDYRYVFDKILSYIYADKDDFSLGLKLIPSKNDENIFNIIMQANFFNEIESFPNINKGEDNYLYNNFKTIYERLKSTATDGSILRNVILEGLQLLVIVEMNLDSGDDPQAIFESINSLGLKLSNADLIRNYLLMSAPNQKVLYEKYWAVIQDEIIGEKNMEYFLFNYLMMKKSYAINNDSIYKEYVVYANKEFEGLNIDKEALLKDLLDVAKIFKVFLKEDSKYSANTNMLMQELREMGQTTAYPFLMKVFLDSKDEKTLNKVINLIIVYLVRRTICEVPTRSLRGFMLNLYNRVFKVESNKTKYYESIYAFLSQLKTNDRLRDIEEVSESLKTAEIYKNVKFATYLLYKVENGRYPNPYEEFSMTKEASIEHIMPQTLTDEWIAMLGDDAEEIHKKYLHTLGNLSLSSRSKNSIMSNESFIVKRDILRRPDSKFVVLNKDIGSDQISFGKEEIEKREERLSKIVCSKYNLDLVDTSGIKFEDSVEIVCSTDFEEVFSSTTPLAYKLLDKDVSVDSFSKIIVGVAKTLFEKYPEKMRELAANNFNPWDGGDRKCIHYTIDENDKDQLIGENIRINTNYSSIYCVQFATLLMKQFDIDADQLIIYLKKDSIKTDNVLPKKIRVNIVRKALEDLACGGKILYDYKNMTKNDDWIKFQIKELNELFPFSEKTTWDGELFNSICYLEYHLSTNEIVLTLKNMKKTAAIVEKLKANSDILGIKYIDSTYWHIKTYNVDYKTVYLSSNRISAMKEQIESVLVIILEDLAKIANVLNN